MFGHVIFCYDAFYGVGDRFVPRAQKQLQSAAGWSGRRFVGCPSRRHVFLGSMGAKQGKQAQQGSAFCISFSTLTSCSGARFCRTFTHGSCFC
jgi:hypothetical protein